MATMRDIEIKHETRICQVDHEVGLFHCWEQYMDVVAPGLYVGSHPGGQIARVYGIVEFTNDVRRIDPSRIRFIDSKNKCLGKYIDRLNKKAEKEGTDAVSD